MAKDEPRLNEVDVSEVPEVADYQKLKATYQNFRASNPEFFKYLDQLVEELNIKQEAAEKAVRAKMMSCGDFHLYQMRTTLDVDALYDLIGRADFLRIGGSFRTVEEKVMAPAQVKVAVANQSIPEAVGEAVLSKEGRWHMPKKSLIP